MRDKCHPLIPNRMYFFTPFNTLEYAGWGRMTNTENKVHKFVVENNLVLAITIEFAIFK